MKIKCIRSQEPYLKKGAAYEVVPDPDCEKFGFLRVIDDSGFDTLYPVKLFKIVKGKQNGILVG